MIKMYWNYDIIIFRAWQVCIMSASDITVTHPP